MKKIIIPNQKKIENVQGIDGFLLGLESLSTNFYHTYKIEEIKKMIEEYPNKEIFVAVNKNILNSELSLLEEKLQELETLPIKGILFYDLAVLHMKKRKSLKIPLYWAQEHFTTNYLTIEYYRKEGVKGTCISSDITKEEILEIRKNTEGEMMVPIFGYLPIFASRRHLVQNYEKTFAVKGEGNVYTFEKDDKKYRIIDEKEGTTAYSACLLNGFSMYDDLEQNKIEYSIINGQFIKDDIWNKVLSIITSDEKEKEVKINEVCQNTDTGFLYKETFYKVK